MKKNLLLIFFLIPFIAIGQKLATVTSIDSFVLKIENDPTLVRKVYDTVRYVKEDGGNRWDSLYNHREYFLKDGQLVKILAWNKYVGWRNDMSSYYDNNKVVKFSKGESFEGTPDYGKLNFEIYYYQDKEITVSWLTPKPNNVMGVATDMFLIWAYSLQKETW